MTSCISDKNRTHTHTTQINEITLTQVNQNLDQNCF